MNYFEDLSSIIIADHLRQEGPHKFYYLDIMIKRDRIRKNLHTRDKRDAVQRATEIIRQRMLSKEKETQSKEPTAMKLSGFKDKLLKTYLTGVSKGRAGKASLALTRLKDFLGDVDINDITVGMADEFRLKLYSDGVKDRDGVTTKLTARTINNNMEVLRACFNYAFKTGKWISSNPFKDYKKMTVEVHDPNPYLPETMRDIIEEARKIDEDFGATVEIYVYTGMRLSEGTKLTTNDVNFDHWTITLRASTTKMKRKRVVPLNSRCVDLLHHNCEKYGKPIPFTPRQVDELFAQVRDKLGFEGRFHDIRKTTNTYLKYYAGLDDSICEKILGHDTPNNTNSKIYTGFIEAPIFAAMEKIYETLFPEHPETSRGAEQKINPETQEPVEAIDGSSVEELPPMN